MKEEFLHFLWKFQLFPTSKLKTSQNLLLKVISNGLHNHLEGPDFLNAKIQIDSQLWAGNIEIHVKSSDWYQHHHENDSNYNAVILHVVWEYDSEVFGQDNNPIPTLELKDLIPNHIIQKYELLMGSKKNWIPCQREIASIENMYLNPWLERLYVQRLESKSNSIFQLLDESNYDWEYVLFQLLSKNFGLKVNGEAFLLWSKSIPSAILRKERDGLFGLSALFFGQAHLLEAPIENEYYLGLQEEYRYQKRKYNLRPIKSKTFHFFGMRPTNFPTIRIAQLANLYHQEHHLFSKVIAVKTLQEAYNLFQIELDSFWLKHYTFSKESPKRRKVLSKPFIDLLLINSIIPLQFAYAQSKQKSSEMSFEILREIKPEKNTIIQKFVDLGLKVESAFETQALLELKNNYCAKKRCLQCEIGLQLLKSSSTSS